VVAKGSVEEIKRNKSSLTGAYLSGRLKIHVPEERRKPSEKYARQLLYGSKETYGEVERIEGFEYIDKVINIDQSPIGRTPRSNPATYTKIFDLIRNLFASTLEAKARGYKPSSRLCNLRCM